MGYHRNMDPLLTNNADVPPVSSATVSFGGAAHHVHLAEPTVDMVLSHQTKMVAFFLKTGSIIGNIPLAPVPRSVKDTLRGM